MLDLSISDERKKALCRLERADAKLDITDDFSDRLAPNADNFAQSAVACFLIDDRGNVSLLGVIHTTFAGTGRGYPSEKIPYTAGLLQQMPTFGLEWLSWMENEAAPRQLYRLGWHEACEEPLSLAAVGMSEADLV